MISIPERAGGSRIKHLECAGNTDPKTSNKRSVRLRWRTQAKHKDKSHKPACPNLALPSTQCEHHDKSHKTVMSKLSTAPRQKSQNCNVQTCFRFPPRMSTIPNKNLRRIVSPLHCAM